MKYIACLFLVALISVWLLISSGPVHANSYTSVASGDWGSPSTWSPSGIPGSGDSVTIAGGHTVTISTAVAVGVSPTATAIVVSAGGQLVVTSTGSLKLRGNIVTSPPDVDPSEAVVLQAGSSLNQDTTTGGTDNPNPQPTQPPASGGISPPAMVMVGYAATGASPEQTAWMNSVFSEVYNPHPTNLLATTPNMIETGYVYAYALYHGYVGVLMPWALAQGYNVENMMSHMTQDYKVGAPWAGVDIFDFFETSLGFYGDPHNGVFTVSGSTYTD